MSTKSAQKIDAAGFTVRPDAKHLPTKDQSVRLMSEQEAADLLCISFRTLQAWRVRGGGPRFCKVGRAVRYRLSDLDVWLEKQSRGSTSDVVAA